MAATTWRDTMIESFKSQTATWSVGLLIAILSIFSAEITENVKLALNRADLASKYYEELASDLSEYRFQAELVVEYVERGWTKADSLKSLDTDYNESITKLRKKEWVYQSWMRRYWGEQQASAFAQCMDAVKAFDREVHNLNDEIDAVINKKKEKFDKNAAAAAVDRLKPALTTLLDSSENLNEKLK
jgi:hypothetical protein